MAIRLSGKGIGLSNKGIGRRKDYIENPVEDMIASTGIRVKRYDREKLDINSYLSREDAESFKRMPPAKRQQIMYEFSRSPEYKNIENMLENYKLENDIKTSISVHEPVRTQKIRYNEDYMYSVPVRNNFRSENRSYDIPESNAGTIHLSKEQNMDHENMTDRMHDTIQENHDEVTSYREATHVQDGMSDDYNALSVTDMSDDVLSSPADNTFDKSAKSKRKRTARIRLSDEKNTDNSSSGSEYENNSSYANSSDSNNSNSNKSNSSNEGHSSERTHHEYSYTESQTYQAENVNTATETAGTATETAAEGAEAAAGASSAGTSEIVKAAEKAVKKYADTIQQAVEQDSNDRGVPKEIPENESITTAASGIMSKLTTTAITMGAFVATYFSTVIFQVIAIILFVAVIAALVISVITSVAGVITNTVNKVSNGIRMYMLSENTISYSQDLNEAANDNEILNYVNYLMAIMEVESHGNGNDPMQSSESAGLPPDSFDNPKDSINQGAYYFACCISKANDEGCDLMTAVQAYNFGTGFINYVADNGGKYTLDLAISFAEEYSGGIQVDYSNPIAVDYNGGWRYAYGNMFYAQLVNQYIYSYEDAAVQKIIDEAMKYYGWEYTWGGSNPDEGFDCSGLVQWCYATAGIELPRTSREQWDWCEEISVDDIVPGDLLFYQNESSGGEIGHVAIYIGDGKVYEAGDPIGVYDNNDSWHQDNLLNAGRIIHFEPDEGLEDE
jgi:hypothetical protein